MTNNVPAPAPGPTGEVILYQSEDGSSRIQVRLQGETVRLSLNQMADLFQRDKSVISRTSPTCLRKVSCGGRQLLQFLQQLNAEELEALNRIVTAYLEFAELQALNRRPMYMADWIAKLDDFLRLSDRDILTHAGRISHEAALTKAEGEFERFRQAQASLPQPVDQHFEQALDELQKIAEQKKALPAKKRTKRPKSPRSGGEA
jgi:hypothetical protein